MIQEDLTLPIERLFLEFDREPIAAASIGQVHRAVLPNGHKVAVKVQRPGAPEQIEADLGLLYQAARIAKERVRALDFVDVRQVVDEFARAIRAGARLPPRSPQRPNAPPQLRRPPARPHPARLLELHARSRPDARVHRGLPARGHRRVRLHHRAAKATRRGHLRSLDDDDLPGRVLPRRPAPGEHPRRQARRDRARRLRPGREAHRRRHREGDEALHRRRQRERRGPAEAPRRPRRPLPEGARGRIPPGDPRALLPLLRREPRRDRSAAGDPRGLRPHLLAQPAASDPVHHPRQGDRDPRLGRRRALSAVQRLRGREAVRAEPAPRAVHAAAHDLPRSRANR